MTPEEHITLREARYILYALTGLFLTPQILTGILHRYPHLAVWTIADDDNGERQLRGVRRSRWVYFLKIRVLLRGPDGMFEEEEEEDAPC